MPVEPRARPRTPQGRRHPRNPKILENQAKSSFRHAKMSIYKAIASPLQSWSENHFHLLDLLNY